MALRMDERSILKRFHDLCLIRLPMAFDLDIRWQPRRLWLYTRLPVRRDWLMETMTDAVLDVLPETQDETALLKTLPETVMTTVRGTLSGTLSGTPQYLRTYPKQDTGRWVACIYLDKLIAIGNEAIRLGKAAFVVRNLFDEQRSEPQYVSVRSIQAMMALIDSASTREGLAIKARLERMGIAKPNGRKHTHGSEVIRCR